MSHLESLELTCGTGTKHNNLTSIKARLELYIYTPVRSVYHLQVMKSSVIKKQKNYLDLDLIEPGEICRGNIACLFDRLMAKTFPISLQNCENISQNILLRT